MEKATGSIRTPEGLEQNRHFFKGVGQEEPFDNVNTGLLDLGAYWESSLDPL